MKLTLEKLRKATGGGTLEDHERWIRETEARTGKKVKRIRIPKGRSLKLR